MRKIWIFLMPVVLCISCAVQQPLTEEQYHAQIRKALPFVVKEWKVQKQDIYAFYCDKQVNLLPDYEVNDEGVVSIYRTTFEKPSGKQSEQVIWRNILIDKKGGRVVCIDRLLKKNRTFGYVYVLQGETKAIPNGYHWDVTDPRHLLLVAPALESMSELSTERLKTELPVQEN